MKARIVNYRSGRHTQVTNQMIIQVEGCGDREAATKLVGKSVMWKTPSGKELKGKIASAHGNSGCVRALFETGIPGQAVGKSIEVN